MPKRALRGKSGPQAKAYRKSICRYDLGKHSCGAAQILFQRAKVMAMETMAMVTQNLKMTIKI